MNSLKSLEQNGYVNFGPIIDEALCDEILASVKKTRKFGPELFFTEEDFEILKPNAFNKNPRPGCNLSDDLEPLMKQVEESPVLTEYLTELLGEDYNIYRRKFVCGASEAWLPEWIQKRVAGQPSNNLAHFVRPEYTDITYFYGIDFHQDLVDWPDRDPDFVTVYVYIDDVSHQQAPLFVLPQSHTLGADAFPHDLALEKDSEKSWKYKVRSGKEMTADHVVLTGQKGSVFSWHALTLHGTQPATVPQPRISIRYLIERGKKAGDTGIDRINKSIGDDLRLPVPRHDLDGDGLAVVENNSLYGLIDRQA